MVQALIKSKRPERIHSVGYVAFGLLMVGALSARSTAFSGALSAPCPALSANSPAIFASVSKMTITTDRPFETGAKPSASLGVVLQDDPMAAGLKECLLQGVERAVEELSRFDGYYARPEIRIPLPPEAEAAAGKLRSMGLSKRVDELIMSLNRSAEEAAPEAKSLFVNAIRQMKPSDAMGIVRGGDDAATRYLRSQMEVTLIDRFTPAIDASLQQSGASDKWEGFVGVYNRIPGVRRLDTDLTRHVCQQAISGLFLKVAEEEKAIRSQPARRTTDLLRNVFGRP